MPCVKCSNGKYKFGSGKCQYTSLAACKRAAAAYYATHPNEKDNVDDRESSGILDAERKEIRGNDITKKW